MREARTEAALVLAIDVALFAGLAIVDQAKGWNLIDLPPWAWLLFAVPALVLMTLLLVVPLAELSPGRARNAGIVLLGLLVVSDAVAVGVLLAALAGSQRRRPQRRRPTGPRHGRLAHQHHHVRPAVLATRRGRSAAARRGATAATPTSQFPQDATPRKRLEPRG